MSQKDQRFTTTLAALLLAAGSAGCMDFEGLDEPIVLDTHVQDWRDQVIYQVLIDRFADGDQGNNHNVVTGGSLAKWHGGDWKGLEDNLDYLAELGVTTLWISPIVKNLETDAGFDGYHGYWTQSFVDLNPHFGDLITLRSLVKAAHDRGMLIIVDIVTNHIGQLFYYDINRNGQPDDFFIGGGMIPPYGSGSHDFPSDLTRTSEWDPEYDSRGIQAFSSLGESGPAPIEWVYVPEINRIPPEPAVFQNKAWYNRRGRVTVWRHEDEACRFVTGEPDPGSWRDRPECVAYIRTQETKGDFPGGLKDIDTTRCDVKQAMVDVFARWVELTDVDGFRIDTLKHVEHEFWRYFTQKVRQRLAAQGKSSFFMFGEAFDGYTPLVGSYTINDDPNEQPTAEEQSCVTDGRPLTGDMVDGVFHFPQYYTAFQDVIAKAGATTPIEALWKTHNGITDPADPSEDELFGNVPNQLGAQGIGESGQTVGLPPYKTLVNFLDNHDVSRFLFSSTDRRLHLALLLQLTEMGIPCIYYGTEQEFAGGNDPANREDMWDPDFSDPAQREALWEAGYDQTNPTYQWIRRLTAMRKAYVALRRGDQRVVWSTPNTGDESDAGIFAFERTGGDAGTAYALIVLNTNPDHDSTTESGGTPMTVSASGNLVDVLDGQSYTVGAGGTLTITVEPNWGAILIPESEVVPGL